MKLSIIIPVYNEERTVAELIKRVSTANLPKDLKKEIIIIDDGSYDRTLQVINKIRTKTFKLITHASNRGKGAAVRTGLENATGDIFIIQDADLEYDPNDYIKLLEPIRKKKAQVVYGTRLADYPLKLWGKEKTPLPLNLIANKFLTFLTNTLYVSQITDMETCYKVFTKDVLNNITLSSNRFNIEPEITAKILNRGYDIYEIPIKVNPRTYKEGKKINWKDGVSAVWTLLKYRFTN